MRQGFLGLHRLLSQDVRRHLGLHADQGDVVRHGKVSGSEQAVQTFADIGAGQWLRYLTGVLEIAFGLGLLIPRLSGLAALGLTGVMTGAVLAEVVLLDADVLVPLILLGLVAVIAWFRRDDTLRVLRLLRRGR